MDICQILLQNHISGFCSRFLWKWFTGSCLTQCIIIIPVKPTRAAFWGKQRSELGIWCSTSSTKGITFLLTFDPPHLTRRSHFAPAHCLRSFCCVAMLCRKAGRPWGFQEFIWRSWIITWQCILIILSAGGSCKQTRTSFSWKTVVCSLTPFLTSAYFSFPLINYFHFKELCQPNAQNSIAPF